MKASVIIPCHPRNLAQLSRTLESIDRAAEGLEVERIVIHDDDSRGPSWARNRGLEKATGEYVFFADADDCVEPEFFRSPLAALERTGADVCLFSDFGESCRVAGEVIGNENVRKAYLPAFFGYSFEDVRRWNGGGALAARKEMGSVWLAAFRRDFISRHTIRFDERMTMYEDAAFLSYAMAYAERVVTLADKLYRYEPIATGNMRTGYHSRRNWEYKFVALDFRKRLDAACGGALWRYCEASCVFSALELMKARHRFFEYLRDARVRKAIREFPISIRHPLVAAAVLFMRGLP